MSKIIKPFIGVDNYKLLSSEQDIVELLKYELINDIELPPLEDEE